LATSAQLFAESPDGGQIVVTGAGGQLRGPAAIWKRYPGSLPDNWDAQQRVLKGYHVQQHDVEDAINQLLGRDPEQHRPPHLSWGPLIDLLGQHGVTVSEEELVTMPFVFELSPESSSVFEG